jgi:hypothetical protein
MRLVRGLGGALLWILASVLGLVAVLLCVTLILLPLGIPLLRLARKMWTTSVRLMVPRSVAHPVKEMDRKRRKRGSAMADDLGSMSKRARKKARAMSKKSGKLTRRQRKKLTG